MASPARRLAIALAAASALLFPHAVSTGEDGPRRLTRTRHEETNLNPSVSGDGRRAAFESSADLASSHADRALRLFALDVDEGKPFDELAPSRGPAPSLSQDGSRVAFASRDDPLGTNRDGDSEIFLLDRGRLRQLTDTLPDDPSRRAAQGSFQPSISDDGRLLAFTSDRDLTGANPDRNHEVFLYDDSTRAFSQLTDTGAAARAAQAKISGDGSRLAYIFDGDGEGGAPPDLVLYETATRTFRTAAAGVAGLAFTYGRAVSDDGLRVVYSAQTSANSAQVFLLDARNDSRVRRLTNLGPRASDVPPHPTVSGDGNRVAFATRRNVTGGNPDVGVELYVLDIPSNAVTRVTSAPAAATAEVVSSLGDDGRSLVFNFPRVLDDEGVPEEFANNSEIFHASLPPVAASAGGLEILNGASSGKSPSPAGTVAPDSIAVAAGVNLSLVTAGAEASPRRTFPTTFHNVSVNVGGLPAQIFYVSPTRVHFHVPAAVAHGPAEVVVRNHDGFERRGLVTVLPSAPGLFTSRGDGAGEAVALDNATLRHGPFAVTDARGAPTHLIIFATGARRAGHVEALIDGRTAKVDAVLPSPDLPGLDQIHVALSARLRGAGSVPLLVRAAGVESNRAALTLNAEGAPPRASRLVVTPEASTIPVGGELKLRARAFDALGEEIDGPALTFLSRSPAVAGVNPEGLARGLSTGDTAVLVTSGDAAAQVRLRVLASTLVVNEILADPPDGAAGDANRDGTRSGSEDEFVELVNASGEALDLSGWTLRTRPNASANETARHVFPAGLSLPAGEALVLFGGGSPAVDDPFFGGAPVALASSGSLSLTNGSLTLVVRDADGNLVTQVSYGPGASDFDGEPADQSLTRSPDVSGPFVLHTTADASRKFSPGFKSVGGLFLERPARLSSLTLRPTTQTHFTGEPAALTARAFDQFGRPMENVSVSFDAAEPGVVKLLSVTPGEQAGTFNAVFECANAGTARVTATASDGSKTLNSPPAIIEVKHLPPRVARVEITPASVAINRGLSRQFSAAAFDEKGEPVAGAAFVWSSGDEAVAAVEASGLVRAVGAGSTSVEVTTDDNRGGLVRGRAELNVRLPLVINEVLADVPPDDASTDEVEGDTNLDGVRNSDDDEFAEILNDSNEPLDLSGVQLSDSSNVRFTFPAGTTLGAGRALILYGGGNPPAEHPALGGALVFKAGSLSLNDSGDSLTFKLPLPSGAFTAAAFAYGAGSPHAAPRDQSLTRSPDADAGADGDAFTPHAGATDAAGRPYSPGTRADGTPFGSPPLTRVEVAPASASLDAGAAQTFNARAFATSDGVETEITRLSFAWTSTDPRKATLSNSTGLSTTARALAPGPTTLRARAGSLEGAALLNVNPTPTPTPSPTPTPTPTPTPSPTPALTPTPTPSPTPTPAGRLVISQIYGGGGNSGAAFRNDFVEIFNAGGAAVSLSGWSVQYASAAGSTWQVTTLSGSLAPGRYYLVQQASGGTTGAALPAPDASGSINLAATAGKVALVNAAAALNGPCPSGASVVDFVGYGTSANCSESGPAAAPSATASLQRKGDGCTDTGNNAADFAAVTPSPRNSAAPSKTCAEGAGFPLMEGRPASLSELFRFGLFSGRRPEAGWTRWRRGASAYAPRGTPGARPRPPAAWP